MFCEEKKVYSLTQHNDTNFADNHFLIDYLETSLDLTNYTVECVVPKAFFSKELTLDYDIELQKYYVTIDFTAEETAKMPLGEQDIYLVVYDANKRQQSLKRIYIKVLRRGS